MLAGEIKRLFEMYDHIYGYRRITDEINIELNAHYNHKRIYRIMNILSLKSVIRRKPKSCTVRKQSNTAKNKLGRNNEAARPNEKWVTDVSEFKYGERKNHKVYLSVVFDLYDRTPVAFAIEDHNDNPLVFDTFRKAFDKNPQAHPLVHSDGGYQYTSPYFVKMLSDHGCEQSMSRVHCCIDNGVCEGFWGIIKSEIRYYERTFMTREELVNTISGYIRFYTYARRQKRYGLKTPYEVRTEAMKAIAENKMPKLYKIPVNNKIIRWKKEHNIPVK